MTVRVMVALAVVLLASGARADALRDLSGQYSARVTCSIAAALKFNVPVNVMLAVAEMEGGRPGQWVRNRNGSYDVGPLQFNTGYLEHLERRYGITPADVAAAGCYPYELAAWRLRRHLERDQGGDAWTRVANYHSRNAIYDVKYRRKLMRKAASWSRWLSARFQTYEVNGLIAERGSARRRSANVGREARSSAMSLELATAITEASAYGDNDTELAALLELRKPAPPPSRPAHERPQPAPATLADGRPGWIQHALPVVVAPSRGPDMDHLPSSGSRRGTS